MITNLIAYRDERNTKLVKDWMRHCTDDGFVLFSTAYSVEFGCIDRYEIRCNLDRYKRSGEIPAYLLSYIKNMN